MRWLAAYMMCLGLWAETHHAAAQGFIRHFDAEQDGFAGEILSVREVADGYLLFCKQISNDGTFRTHLFTRVIDGTGAQLIEREFFDSIPRHYIPGKVDPVATCADGTFAVAIYDWGVDFDLGISLFQFDQQGDTLFTNSVIRFPIEDSMIVNMHHTRQCADGGLYMAGTFDPYSPEWARAQALLVRTNALGDTLWTKRYGPGIGAGYIAQGVVEYLDGGAVIIGGRSPGQNKCFIIRTDSQGNEIWSRYFGGDTGADFGAVRLDDSGGIVSYSAYHEDSFQNIYHAQFMFTKWSPDGDIVWQKKSHYGNYYTNADFEILPDNSIIAVGKHAYGAELMKFSSEGDSLWTRTYLAFASGDFHYLWDVQPTSDGGFIAAGSCLQRPGDPSPFLETEWVLKTDSFGCVVPGCQNVGVQEYEIMLEEHLELSPNPASDRLTFQLPLPTGFTLDGKAQVMLLDAQGRVVLERSLAASNSALNEALDVSELPPGLYYLHLRDQRRWLAGGKVVVESSQR